MRGEAERALKVSTTLSLQQSKTVHALPCIRESGSFGYSPTTGVWARLDDGLARLAVDGKVVNCASLDGRGATKKRGSSRSLGGAGTNEMNHLCPFSKLVARSGR